MKTKQPHPSLFPRGQSQHPERACCPLRRGLITSYPPLLARCLTTPCPALPVIHSGAFAPAAPAAWSALTQEPCLLLSPPYPPGFGMTCPPATSCSSATLCCLVPYHLSLNLP